MTDRLGKGCGCGGGVFVPEVLKMGRKHYISRSFGGRECLCFFQHTVRATAVSLLTVTMERGEEKQSDCSWI